MNKTKRFYIIARDRERPETHTNMRDLLKSLDETWDNPEVYEITIDENGDPFITEPPPKIRVVPREEIEG